MKRYIGTAVALLMLILIVGCETTANKTKEVENLEITLTFPVWDGAETITIERTGTYTGPIQNDLPNGVGKFETQNEEGSPWHYEGEFKDGLFHGKGKQTSANSDELMIGNFVDGVFAPTKSQFYAYVSQFEPKFILQEKSATLINSNESIFPCTTEENKTVAISLTNFDAQYKQLSKNANDHLEKLIRVQNMTATQVFEESLFGYKLTQIIAYDQDYNYYTIYYNGSIELYDGDVFELYGLPFASSSFSNVDGGTTNVVVMLSSIINIA